MEKARRLGPGTIVMAALGVAALLFYGWFLSVNFAPKAYPGDAVVGQAYEELTAVALMWLTLFVLMAMDRAIGGASWPRRAGYLVVPVAAVAHTFATDSPHDLLCQIAVWGLPLLTGLYVLLGRLPKRQAAGAQGVVLAVMAALSANAIMLFMR